MMATQQLYWLAHSNHYKCVNELLKSGADVNSGKNKEGCTALHIASRYGYYECLDLLLDAGADVNITDAYGVNALHVTEQGPYRRHLPTCIKRLLGAGININRFSNSTGKNALQTILGIKKHKHDLHLYLIGYKGAVDLLYAAGETLEGTEVEKIAEELKFEEEKLQLKHICREAIRKHLLKLDPHQHLFGRIPELGLPSIVTEYLLFNQSLDDNDSDDDNDDIDDDEVDVDDINDYFYYEDSDEAKKGIRKYRKAVKRQYENYRSGKKVDDKNDRIYYYW